MEISPITRRKRTKRRSPWLWAAPLIAAAVFLVIAVSAGGPLVITPDAMGVQSEADFVIASIREIDCVVPQRSRRPGLPR